MAFPTTGILDAFGRADEGPPPSASWVTSSGLGHQVVTNAAQANATDTFTASTWNSSFAADQECYFDATQMGSGASAYFVTSVRIATAATYLSNHYELNWYGSTLEVWKRFDGVWTQRGASISYTFAANDQLGLEVSGTTLTAYQNSTSLGTRTDSDVSGSGFTGVGTNWPSGATAPRLDDFGGGAIVVAGGGLPRDPAHTPQHQAVMAM